MAFHTEERLINRPLDSSDLLIDFLPISTQIFFSILVVLGICLIILIVSKQKNASHKNKKIITIQICSLISLIIIQVFLYSSALQDVKVVKNIKNKITYVYKKKYSEEYFAEKRKERVVGKKNHSILTDFSFDEADYYKKLYQKLNNDEEYNNDIQTGLKLSDSLLLKEKLLYVAMPISFMYSFILALIHLISIVTNTKKKRDFSTKRNNWIK